MSKQLIPYCIGICATPCVPDSREIEVYPVEKLPSAKGEFKGEPAEELEGEYKDYEEKSYSYKLKRWNTLTATWLPWQAYNRITAPNIQPGEYVILFKYLGEDSFYWIPIFTEANLRTRESVIHFYSNKDELVTDPKDESVAKRGYTTIIDTIAKLVYLHTDKNEDAKETDPEKAGYDIGLNTKDGVFTFQDTEDNKLEFQSVEGHLNFVMQGNADIQLTNSSPNGEEDKKGDINVMAQGDVTLEFPNKDDSKGNISITAAGDYNLKLDNSDKGNIKVEAQGDVTLEFPNKGNIKLTAAGDTDITIQKGVKANISKNLEIELDKLKISNGADELIQLLIDLCDLIDGLQILGNQGAPAPVFPGYKPKIVALKTKLQGFKA